MEDAELVRIGKFWFEDMWNIPDFELAEQIVAPNYKPEWIHINAIGPELIKREIKHFRSIFPDLNQKVIDINPLDNKIWVRYKAKATHLGNAWGFKPTNKNIEFEAAAILYVNNEGKVYDLWEAYCFYDMLEQLGVVPSFYELYKYFSEYSK
ncbi:MAG: ester cyclase [Candidatus Thorarchaeota archaeon]